MDYEKVYKDALERAKEIHDSPDASPARKKMLEGIFPDLIESEDERIRKEIIGLIKEVGQDETYHISRYNEMLAYLEKRKEQKPNIELIQRSWYMEGYHDREFGQEPKWIIKTGKEGPKYEKNEKYGQPLEQKQKVQKGSLRVIKDASEWENIKEQNPAEWSEEDDIIIDGIIANLEYLLCNTVLVQSTKENIEARLRWMKRLKSLRPQPHWKPSEEQMESLYNAVIRCKACSNTVHLPELYEDLLTHY